jgi:septal ring factor EnvC (AmiA/AmiB activator)
MSTMQPQQQLHQQQGMVQQHPSPGGIPSPEKMPGMGMYGAHSMAVGMTTMPSLEKQQPQMFQHQQPQMMMPGMVQQQPQQMGVANGYAGYGGGALGGETVDDAFAGLSNDPVADVDEYSAVGSAIGGTPHMSYPPPAAASLPVQSQIVSPLASPTFAPVQAPRQPVSSSPVHVQPVVTAASISAPKSPSPITGNANAELEKLRAAHQKLQAEAISLRAKAGFVSDEGNETQAEITKVASEIATLSMTLGDLKTQVMEAKVKLADAVATLKALKEKKESLEKAVEESRETCDALNSATEAVVEANEEMIAHHARAVAAAAAAREAAEAPGADLFSWDAPAPAMQAMGTPWGGEQPAAAAASLPKLAPVADAGSVYSTNSAQHSVENTSAWGAGYGYGGDNMTPTNHYPPDGMMGMGASPMQQPKVAPTVNTAAQPVQQLPTIESPTAEQIDQLKRDALVAEKSFRSSKDLVKTLSKEVKNLEAAALKAEEEKKAIEAKKTKIGGKKTKKKEIEKAYEFAMGEQKKVEEAREQLEAAIRQADMAKSEAEKLRQQYEEAEVEAATAASYLSMNASHSVGPGIASQQQYQQQYQQPSPMYSDPFGMGSGGHIRTTSDSYGDGMGGGMGHGRTTSDPYAMGLMGGSANGDYANPFAI